MANAKIQPFTSLDQSKHHCYTLSTTCTLFKLASEVGPRTNTYTSDYARIEEHYEQPITTIRSNTGVYILLNKLAQRGDVTI